jgi:hypothetical protein
MIKINVSFDAQKFIDKYDVELEDFRVIDDYLICDLLQDLTEDDIADCIITPPDPKVAEHFELPVIAPDFIVQSPKPKLLLKARLEVLSVHAYTTSAYRAWNNDTANRVQIIIPFDETIFISIGGRARNNATLSLGINQTTGRDLPAVNYGQATYVSTGAVFDSYVFSAGYNYLQAVEYGGASSNFTDFFIIASIMG